MNIEKEIHKNPYHYFQLDSKKQSNQNIISKTLESIKERALAQHKHCLLYTSNEIFRKPKLHK